MSSCSSPGSQAHNFLIDDFCDVYIEASKPLLQSADAAVQETALAQLHSCMRTTLRLLHPLLPHLTEELNQRLFAHSDAQYLISAAYPVPSAAEFTGWSDHIAERDFARIMLIVKAIRSLRVEQQTMTGRPAVEIRVSETMAQLVRDESWLIARLALTGPVSITLAEPHGAADSLAVGSRRVDEDVVVMVSVPAKLIGKQLATAEKQLRTIEARATTLATRLDSPGFRGGASAEVIARACADLSAAQAELLEIRRTVAKLHSELASHSSSAV